MPLDPGAPNPAVVLTKAGNRPVESQCKKAGEGKTRHLCKRYKAHRAGRLAPSPMMNEFNEYVGLVGGF